MHILYAEHLLKSQIKGIEEEQNRLLSPIKHNCALNYAYCLTLLGILLWETFLWVCQKGRLPEA